MSRAVLWGLAALLSVGTARAQTASELNRRLDVAVAKHAEATRQLDSARLARGESRVFRDTVTLLDGAVVVPTSSDLLPTVQKAAARADSVIRRRVGRLVSAIPRTMITMRPDTTSREKAGAIATILTNGLESDPQFLDATVDAVTRVLENRAQRSLFVVRPQIGRWLTVPLPDDSATDATWRATRLEMASSRAVASRRCYDGDVPACKAILGLTSEPDPATTWYDSAARINAVRSYSAVGLDREPRARCLAGHDADCIDLIRYSPALNALSAPPLSATSRIGLLQLAVSDGGDGGVGRLLERNDSVSAALSAAAKLPIDSVVAHWRQHVHDAAVRSTAFSPGIALLSIGWIVILGWFGTRSSRWR